MFPILWFAFNTPKLPACFGLSLNVSLTLLFRICCTGIKFSLLDALSFLIDTISSFDNKASTMNAWFSPIVTAFTPVFLVLCAILKKVGTINGEFWKLLFALLIGAAKTYTEATPF